MLIPACDHFNQKDVNAYHFLLIVSTSECNNNKTRNKKKSLFQATCRDSNIKSLDIATFK
jgi:hypothetical protein